MAAEEVGEEPRAAEPSRPSRAKRDAKDCIKRISRVWGTIQYSRNLARRTNRSKPDAYVVVKGIRSNNRLVTLHTTKCIARNDFPHWDEHFSFDCPEHWGLNPIVGLKFLVYDAERKVTSDIGTETFLGGADLDLQGMAPGRTAHHVFMLGGLDLQRVAKGSENKRCLLDADIAISYSNTPKPPPPEAFVLESMESFSRVSELQVNIVRARYLRNTDTFSKSDPVCVVRLVTLSGRVDEVYRTRVVQDDLNPEFNEAFTRVFEEGKRAADEPILLVFDIFDADGDYDPNCKISQIGDHLGSGILALQDLPDGDRTRKRLALRGETQLLETFLARDGKTVNKVLEHAEEDGGFTSSYESFGADEEQGRVRSAISDAIQKKGFVSRFIDMLRRADSGANGAKTALMLEVTAKRVQEPMMFHSLLHNPFTIQEEEDVQEIAGWPAWERSIFKMPEKLRHDYEHGGRPKLGTLSAREKICFVSGVIRGASGLPAMDVGGKTDPYCIVEAVTISGDVYFIHRTRFLKGKLTPEWEEAFYWAVPERLIVKRLNFHIYDSDTHGLESLVNTEDDFIGRTSVDISDLRTGNRIREEVPLTSCAGQNKPNGKDGFRRSPAVCIDVRVERRIMPIYQIHRNQIDWKPQPRHLQSRPPKQEEAADFYRDPSQHRDLPDDTLAIAAHVLQALEGNQLASQGLRRDAAEHANLDGHEDNDRHWQRPPRCEVWRGLSGDPGREILRKPVVQESEEDGLVRGYFEEAAEAAERARVAEERRAQAEASIAVLCACEGLRRSGMPARGRAGSLPLLRSRLPHRPCTTVPSAARQCEPEWVSHREVTEAVMRRKPPIHLSRMLA